jgi:hypothetical protein
MTCMICFSIYALGHPGVAYHRVALAEMIPLPLKLFIACILYFSICLWHIHIMYCSVKKSALVCCGALLVINIVTDNY